MPQTEQKLKNKKAVTLSAEELAALDEGIVSSEKEQRYTLDETLEFAKKRREQWTENQVRA